MAFFPFDCAVLSFVGWILFQFIFSFAIWVLPLHWLPSVKWLGWTEKRTYSTPISIGNNMTINNETPTVKWVRWILSFGRSGKHEDINSMKFIFDAMLNGWLSKMIRHFQENNGTKWLAKTWNVWFIHHFVEIDSRLQMFNCVGLEKCSTIFAAIRGNLHAFCLLKSWKFCIIGSANEKKETFFFISFS